MLTQQRAQEVWELRGLQNVLPYTKEGAGRFDTYIHPKGLTAAEADYVKRLWDTMPGYTCWMDAFYRVLHGKTEAQS
jgi:hypothetical protein